MDFLTLRYFAAVCEQKNLSRVADQFYISRQALSKSMIHLEQELNAQLLVRERAGIQITEEGQCLYKTVCQMLNLWEESLDDIRDIQASRRRILRVGYGHMAYTMWSVDHVEEFHRLHPDIDVEVRIMLPDQLREALVGKTLDLAITNTGQGPLFYRRQLVQLTTYALVCADDPLAGQEQLAPADLAGREILFLPSSTEFADAFAAMMAREGISFCSRQVPGADLPIIFHAIRETHSIYPTGGIFFPQLGVPEGIYAVPIAITDSDFAKTRSIDAVALKQTGLTDAGRQYVDYLAATVKKRKTDWQS